MNGRKTRLFTALLALMATCLGIQANTVALFYDGTYAQTNASTSSEAYNMKLTLEDLGFTVNTFAGITSNDFATALAGVDTLIITDLESASLGSALSADAIGVLSNFVSSGNSLILNGDEGINDDVLINTVFGHSITSSYYSYESAISSNFNGTVFAGGPPTLPWNNATTPWFTSSLPPGALSIYGASTNAVDYTTVALIPQGSGQIVLLAWDWYNAAPNGTQDGGWSEILGRAVQASAGLNADVYVDLDNATPVPPYASWDTAATTIQEGVDQAADGVTVWVADGTYMPAFEIAVSNSITIQSVNGPDSTIVDGGGVIRCFNLGISACTVSGFTVTNGYTENYGGGFLCSSAIPVITNCVISGNTATYAGGMYYGTANNCILSGNSAIWWGGGMAYGVANNCLVVGNISGGDGSGLDSCQANNCTIIGNSSSGGGMYGGAADNCIVWSNSPVSFVNATLARNTSSPDVSNGVDGNITNAPTFLNPGAGDYRLAAGSPGIDAGNNSYVVGAVDLDGNPRIMNLVVDMGAYELLPLDHYVSAFGSHEYPFETWDRAATNIQDAVDAALDGHTVHVTNDTYNLTSEIVVTSDILIQSVNGPDVTIIDGGGTVRGFNLGSSACAVSGFTVMNGSGYDGGGIYCSSTNPVVYNCFITGNSASHWGGGISGGTVNNCTISGNQGSEIGGIMYAIANNCLIVGNSATGGSVGGAYSGTYNNCTIVSNTALSLVGGVAYGTYNNCVIWYNTASSYDDVYPDGTSAYFVCSPDVINGVNGNITNAPALIDLAGGNYRLKYGSPCINAGSNSIVVGSVDLDWAARIIDTTVDMGAYEYDGSVYDSDGDTLTDDDEVNLYCSSPLLVNTDGDAFDDAYEVANGFAPQIFTDMPGYLADNADSFGFYTESEVLNLGVGDIGGMVTTNGTIDLSVQLWQSGDLITWTNAGPPVFWSEPVDSAVKLYRVGVEN